MSQIFYLSDPSIDHDMEKEVPKGKENDISNHVIQKNLDKKSTPTKTMKSTVTVIEKKPRTPKKSEPYIPEHKNHSRKHSCYNYTPTPASRLPDTRRPQNTIPTNEVLIDLLYMVSKAHQRLGRTLRAAMIEEGILKPRR